VTPALAKDKYPLEVKVTDTNFVKHGEQTGPDTTWTVQATDGKVYEIGCAVAWKSCRKLSVGSVLPAGLKGVRMVVVVPDAYGVWGLMFNPKALNNKGKKIPTEYMILSAK